MLTITVPSEEAFDNATGKFVTTKEYTLQFEHSLASLSKWESIWEKPFLSTESKTTKETTSYLKCMCITEGVPSHIFVNMSKDNQALISSHINAKMTATWFGEQPNRQPSREIITAEIIYYWMITLGIPFECEHWHLNKLLVLIKVCNLKNQPAKKMSTAEANARRAELNAKRRAQHNTTG